MTRSHYSPEALAQLDALETYLVETAGAAVVDAGRGESLAARRKHAVGS